MGDCFSTNNSAHYVQLHYDADDDTSDDTDSDTDNGKSDDTNGNIESELNIFYVTL